MSIPLPGIGGLCGMLAAALLLAACSSHPPAPVVERSTQPRKADIPADGLYRVRAGDSLYAIAFKYGLDHRDLARWNDLKSPELIYPDQILRLTPSRPSAPPPARGSATVRAAPPPRSTTRQQPAPGQTTEPGREVVPSAGRPIPGKWIWPVQGRVLRTFKEGDPARNGLDIGGREGQPVRAAADGEVVYSGNGLIGYGELIIIKHGDVLLSAYAHNRERLVAEGERVEQWQKIAEMGRNGDDVELLHFEIRRVGKPVDPLNYLPKQ